MCTQFYEREVVLPSTAIISVVLFHGYLFSSIGIRTHLQASVLPDQKP